MARVEQELIQEILDEVKPQIEAMLADILKWKRWAVFDTSHFATGGMKDFIAAFHTEEEAEAFHMAHRRRLCLSVVDMQKYLVD